MARFLVFLVAICLAFGLGLPARAQGTLQSGAIALSAGATLTVDDVTISVASVACNDGGTPAGPHNSPPASPVACTNLYLVPASGPGAEVIIEAANGDVPGVSSLVPIFSYTCPATGSCAAVGSKTYDLSVTLDAQAVGTHTTMTSVTQTLVGSATPSSIGSTYPGDVHVTESVLNASNSSVCGSGLSSNLSSLSAACPTFAPLTYLSVKKDLGLTLSGLTNGSTLALWSVAQTFTPAPEPASLATLVAGLFALGFVRRQSRRT